MLLDLAVVIPTYNERDNVFPMFERLERVLAGVRWEVLFVDDDSPDGTAETVRDLARRDARVRLIRRIGRKGLSSACIEGMLATTADYIAVMDADQQHDEAILPGMLEKLRGGALDLVIGSRHAEGGSMGEFTARRVRLSNLGARVSRAVTRCDLRDPMSGFFMLDRRFLQAVAPRLSGVGSRSCWTSWRRPAARYDSPSCRTPFARASTGRASWISWWDSSISTCCSTSSSAT